MILVIDTSSALGAMAAIAEPGSDVREVTFDPRQRPDMAELYRRITADGPLTRVAVATGPGSFTGLRVGVSFGVGLAIGLRIPIVPLGTLALQAARSTDPVLAVSEAGRGRVYFQAPGHATSVGEPGELPAGFGVVGWLKPATHAAMVDVGLMFVPETSLLTFSAAAARLLKSAREVPYGSVKLEYMQSFDVPPARA